MVKNAVYFYGTESDDYAVFNVTNPPTPYDQNTTYEWETNGIDTSGYPPQMSYLYASPVFGPGNLTARCRVTVDGKTSDWSEWCYVQIVYY